jgi:hypothetical protein
MSYNDKVKSLLDKAQAAVEAEYGLSERFENDYINSLIEAQERGEISDLRFSASQQGLRASFSLTNKKNAVA